MSILSHTVFAVSSSSTSSGGGGGGGSGGGVFLSKRSLAMAPWKPQGRALTPTPPQKQPELALERRIVLLS